MSPISDVTAFRSGRWPLGGFPARDPGGVNWAIDNRAVFCFLAHPSCLVVADPAFRTIEMICDHVRAAGDRAALVDLNAIALPGRTTHEPALRDRMDRRDVESRPRLHEDHARLRSLLRRDVRRAVPRRARPSLRAGFRPPAGAGEARGAAAVEDAEDDLRQLDERPLPQGRARRLRRGRRRTSWSGRTGTPTRC